MKPLFLPAMLFALLGSAAVSGAVRLGDTPLTAIVCPAGAPPTVQAAAADLAEFIQRTTGDRLPVAAEPPGPSGNILLGDVPELTAELPPDGFRVIARDGNLIIAGRDYAGGGAIYGIRNPWNPREVYNSELKFGAFGEAGTMYGVYWLLHEVFGVRFYWPGETGTVVQPRGEVIVPGLDVAVAPRFNYRFAWFCNFEDSPEDARWYRRVGFGGLMPAQFVDHYAALVTAFKGEHPEYLALVDGKRDDASLCVNQGGHLCLNAPGLVEDAAEYIKDYFRANPNQNIYPLVPGDGLWRVCGCPACQAEIDPDAPDGGRFSNHIWKFTAAVAALVGEEFPDRYIGCLAYSEYHLPPDRVTLPPNVAVMICFTPGATADPEYRERFEKIFDAWNAKAAHLYCWSYYLQAWMPWRELPQVNVHTLQRSLQFRAARRCEGEFIEAESWIDGVPKPCRMNYPATQHLNLYATARLQWDPGLDLDALLDEYYRLFYGPAEAPMRAFFQLCEERWEAAYPEGGWTPADVFPGETLARLQELLEEAARLAPEESLYAERIAQMQQEFTGGRRTLVHMVSSERPVLGVSRVAPGAIEVDGVLDEAAWGTGGGACMTTKAGEPTPNRTVFYARHDGTMLYCAFILYEPETAKLVTTNEKSIWMDDCVEIFLFPEEPSLYNTSGAQFIVNAANRQATGHFDLGSFNDQWRCDRFRSAVTVDAQRWIVETAIPLDIFGLKPGQRLAANFFRSRGCGQPQQFAAWSPTFIDRHFTPERFGFLELE